MSARTFFIGDTHFGHLKICGFEPTARPFADIEAHDAALIERWNSVVRDDSIVWHLGDVLFGASRGTFDKLSALKGRKKLVMGNHDQYPAAEYLKHFERIYGAAEYKGCLLTHIPSHPSQFERYRANIHGHLHSKKLEDPRYINVSAECVNLTPVPFDELPIPA